MKKKECNIGFIGLGCRGQGLIDMILRYMPEIDFGAICDLYEDRQNQMAAKIFCHRGHTPPMYCDYRKLLARTDLDCVVVATSWDSHIPICLDAMRAGIPVGVEVGGANSIAQCWELVHTYEQTKSPIMLLENCCYDKAELTVLNMIKQNMFGDIIHCEGGYRHDLRDEITEGGEHRHYRLDNYKHRCAELYPTHELGPIAKDLNINRGNRMLMLTSMASKQGGLTAFGQDHHPVGYPDREYPFVQGDVVTTMIKCAHGETITLTHDTSLPRPYSRGHLIQGTQAIYSEDKNGILFAKNCSPGDWHQWDAFEKYLHDFCHPLWKTYDGVGGHGGIDFLVFSAFFASVKNQTPMPIDVYDMAAWMAITPLSEDSIALGSHPVAIPDFTNGKWMHREAFHRSRFCLEDVCNECF